MCILFVILVTDDEKNTHFENSGKIRLFATLHTAQSRHSEITQFLNCTTCAWDDIQEGASLLFLIFGLWSGPTTNLFIERHSGSGESSEGA